jgi:hypothetical protein
MARCGRCGLWNKYPDNHHEQKYAGVCLWYQHRLMGDDVFEDRECSDFFERVPGLTPLDHFEYKTKRDNLGDAYKMAKRSKYLAYIGITVSLISLVASLYRTFFV